MSLPGATLRYDVVDVFTATPFAGNPLAVVHGAAGLNTAALQALAREFHLSETAFPLPATQSGADYRLRIFTPATELPFAGHPSVGAAWVLARDGVIGIGAIVQECGAGLLPITVDADGAELTGGEPSTGPPPRDPAELAAAAGLTVSDVDTRVAAGTASCGVAFAVLAVRAEALPRAAPQPAALAGLDNVTGLLLVTVDAGDDAAVGQARVRMFGAAGIDVAEDPATGSAALALGAWLVERGLLPADGTTPYIVYQGAEIGRPSRLDCTVTARGGAALRCTTRGGVVAVAAGTVLVPPM